MVVVEHSLDVVAHADWVIDLGPGGGRRGGELMFTGTPRDLCRDATSMTGRALSDALTAGRSARLTRAS